MHGSSTPGIPLPPALYACCSRLRSLSFPLEPDLAHAQALSFASIKLVMSEIFHGKTRGILMASALSETGRLTFASQESPAAPRFIRQVWNPAWELGEHSPAVYALDFDSVSTAGTYTISVASPIAATSPAFKIDTGANLYATPLANALYYYETRADGPNYIPNALRTSPGFHLERPEREGVSHSHIQQKGQRCWPLTVATRHWGSTLPAAGGTRATT